MPLSVKIALVSFDMAKRRTLINWSENRCSNPVAVLHIAQSRQRILSLMSF